jgi:hypothetical protein
MLFAMWRRGLFAVILLTFQFGFVRAGDEQWDPGFYVSGVNGEVHAIAMDGNNVYVGGRCTMAGDKEVNNIARWDGSQWHAMGDGLFLDSGGWGQYVEAIVVIAGTVYAGGSFEGSGSTALNHLARWTGSAWVSVGGGCNGRVLALANYNGSLAVGGEFTAPFANIAIWNGTTWSGLGSGVNGEVHAIAANGDDLYAGGIFTEAEGTTVNNIARWDGNQWHALGSGVSQEFGGSVVRSISPGSGYVYAAGLFDHAGGTPANNIARWNGSGWSALGSGLEGGFPQYPGGMWPSINYTPQGYTLFTSGTDLYVGGDFTMAGGLSSSGAASWNGTSWSSIGTGCDYIVRAISGNAGQIFVGGGMMRAGNKIVQHIARWSSGTWAVVGEGKGIGGHVYDLTTDGNRLYAGGKFMTANKDRTSMVASFDGTCWSSLGEGLYEGDYEESMDYVNPVVNALVHDGMHLYAAGFFLKAGTGSAHALARWDGSHWEGLFPQVWDPTDYYSIWKLTKSENNLYFSGNFNYQFIPDDLFFRGVVRWDGSAYYPAGPAFDDSWMTSSISVLAFFDGALYAGGSFTEVGGNTVNYIARWNGSDAWLPLGSGMDNTVSCLIGYNGQLVAGGQFTTAGGNPANRIAAWNGTTWSALGSGLDGSVAALGVRGDELYVAGSFTQAGGNAANHVAVWDGATSTWSNLGSGIEGSAGSIAIVGDHVYFGGQISNAGGKLSQNIACWNAAGGIPSAYTHMAVTDYAVISDETAATLGAAWCDFDSDGDPDLFTANDNLKQDALYRNLPGDFDANSYPPLTTETLSTMGGTWGDYNNDGHPDLYVSHLGSPGTLARNNGDGSFTTVPLMTDNLNSFGSAWADYDLDGDLDLYVTVSGDNNRLYQNNGDGTFTAIATGAPVTDGGSSRNAAWCDIDLDGDPDLYVTNTGDEPNFFYQNNGDGTFTKITTGDPVTDTGESWSASWGDYNNDGYPDLFVGNNGQPNCLYRNNGDGTFIKILSSPIVTDNDHSRSSAWGDFDNDGDLDLFVSNRNDDSKLYMNRGGGSFDRYILASGNFRGTALADMDLDGDLDLFICQDSGPNKLFRNTINEGNHWLEVECRGTETNRLAIGAKVSVQAMVKGQLTWQTREISSQTGFGGQSEMVAHFGLNDSEIVQTLRIQWPGVALWDTTNVAADQRLVIVEKTSEPPPVNHSPVALNDTLVIQQDSVLTVCPLENDSDPDNDPLTIHEAGDVGASWSVSVNPGDTTLTFTPAPGFAGEAVFEYVISDGKGGLDTAEVRITVEESMLVREGGAVPSSFALFQNHPNPFNPVTQIRVDLPKSCEVSLVIYDVLGREIVQLMTGEQAAGQYRVRWDGRDRYGRKVTSGVYFYRIEVGEFVAVRKMLLVR